MRKDTFFVEEFGGFLNLLNLWKGSRLPYVALNYLRDLNVLQLVWIDLCHSFQRHKGDMT